MHLFVMIIVVGSVVVIAVVGGGECTRTRITRGDDLLLVLLDDAWASG